VSIEQDAYDQVRYYTLSLGDPAFIHQHVVDAFIAQHADENTKPIAITFALVGLYLHVEKGFSGQQVQRAQAIHEWCISVWRAYIEQQRAVSELLRDYFSSL
jgi:hypothetical protein